MKRILTNVGRERLLGLGVQVGRCLFSSGGPASSSVFRFVMFKPSERVSSGGKNEENKNDSCRKKWLRMSISSDQVFGPTITFLQNRGLVCRQSLVTLSITLAKICSIHKQV